MLSEHKRQHEQYYRYEISAVMNHVVRACHEIVREHSHCGLWTPTLTSSKPAAATSPPRSK